MDTTTLLEAAGRGDQSAWNAIVDRYQSLLWSIARSYRLSDSDAQDVIQTTWLRLVEHLTQLRNAEALAGWLATTVRRECLKSFRRKGRESTSNGEEWGELPDPGPAIDDALLADERDAALWRALQSLSDRCQRLLRVLMASPPPSYGAVAAALEMPIGSIGPTRQRCLERLRAVVDDDDVLGEGGHSEGGHGEGGHSEGGHSEGGHSEGGHSEGGHSEGGHSEGGHGEGGLGGRAGEDLATDQVRAPGTSGRENRR